MHCIDNGNFKKTYLMESIESYIEILNEIKSDNPNAVFWYRGQKEQSWALEPQLFRYSRRITEQGNLETRQCLKNSYNAIYPNVFSELKDFKKNLKKQNIPNSKIPKNNFDLMYLGQHYNLITPLLDFSTDPLVALFFAIKDLKLNDEQYNIDFYINEFNDDNDYIDNSAAVYVLLPNILNRYSDFKNLSNPIKITDQNYDTFKGFVTGENIPLSPICLLAPKNDYRIIRQSGNFICYGYNMNPIDKYPNKKEFLYKILIPYCFVNKLQSVLELLNINNETILKDNLAYSTNAEAAAYASLSKFDAEIN